MIDMKNFARPSVLLAMAGSAAVGFAAGYLLGRDPQFLRRVMAAAAQGWEQTRLAVAEAREDLADQWAEATESARQDIEEAAFGSGAAAAVATATEAAVATPAAPQAAAPPRKARRRPATSSRRAAPRTTH